MKQLLKYKTRSGKLVAVYFKKVILNETTKSDRRSD